MKIVHVHQVTLHPREDQTAEQCVQEEIQKFRQDFPQYDTLPCSLRMSTRENGVTDLHLVVKDPSRMSVGTAVCWIVGILLVAWFCSSISPR